MRIIKPELSLDGVAAIIGIIGACIYLGEMRQTVNQYGDELKDHEARIRLQERITASKYGSASIGTNYSISGYIKD